MHWTADEVKALRRRLGMTQTEFAERFGINRRTLIRYEEAGAPEDRVNAAAIASLEAAALAAEKQEKPKIEYRPETDYVLGEIGRKLPSLSPSELATVHQLVSRLALKAEMRRDRELTRVLMDELDAEEAGEENDGRLAPMSKSLTGGQHLIRHGTIDDGES